MEYCVHSLSSAKRAHPGSVTYFMFRDHRSKASCPETKVLDFLGCFSLLRSLTVPITSLSEDFHGKPLTCYSSLSSPAISPACCHGEPDSPLLPVIRHAPSLTGRLRVHGSPAQLDQLVVAGHCFSWEPLSTNTE